MRPRRSAGWACWEEYGYPLQAGTYLADNEIELEGTFASSIESILTKLRGGGLGTMGLVMPTRNYVALFQESGVLQTVDKDRLPNFANLDPMWQTSKAISIRVSAISSPICGADCRWFIART